MTTRVLFVTPELEDFVRVGGLASVSAALPRALRSFADVRLIIPGYRSVVSRLNPMGVVARCPALAEMPACTLCRTETADGLPVYVVVCPELYDRAGNPYADPDGGDWRDNDIRFARFASAAALLAGGMLDPDWQADIVHANDWQSALVPAYLSWNDMSTPSILTIHNLAFQGLFPKETLRRIGAPENSFHMEGIEFYDKVSFLKGGLVYSDHLTTVSETYASEITTPEFGCGLEGLLAKRAKAKQLTGILNGIDETWDPRTCDKLSNPFGAGDWQSKRANADHVRKGIQSGALARTVVRACRETGASEGGGSGAIDGRVHCRRGWPDRSDGAGGGQVRSGACRSQPSEPRFDRCRDRVR